MPADRSAGYVGPDRRRPVTAADVRHSAARIALAAFAVVGAWCLMAVLVRDRPAETQHAIVDLARATSGALLVAAAALRFANWRITGTARAAWAAIVLAVAGFAIPALAMLGRISDEHVPAAAPTGLAGGLVHLALIGLCVVALVVPAIVSRLRPLRIAAGVMISLLLVAALVALWGPTVLTYPESLLAATILHASIAGLWTALAIAFVVSGWHRRQRWQLWTGAALAMPVADSVTHALFDATTFGFVVAQAGAELFVATILVGASAVALWQLQTGRGTRLLQVSGELRGVQVDLRAAERDQARRLHDARSTIFAIGGVARLLAHPESSAGVDREELRRLVTDELHRLGAILDPQYRSSGRRFRPSEVLGPLILAHRLAGADIHADVADAWATGRPEATATAVANLLSNARAHAPGAQIWVTVEPAPATGQVRITVADNGPGISATNQSLVLTPGFRGADTAAAGSGLGLVTASRAMAEQGGTLSLGERPGGGTVVTLTLPATDVQAGQPVPVPAAAAPDPAVGRPPVAIGVPAPGAPGTPDTGTPDADMPDADTRTSARRILAATGHGPLRSARPSHQARHPQHQDPLEPVG